MVQKFVPIARANPKKKLPYMSKDTKKMINKRERLFRIYMNTKRDVDFRKYRELRNKVNAAIRRDKLYELHKKSSLFKQNNNTVMSSQKV